MPDTNIDIAAGQSSSCAHPMRSAEEYAPFVDTNYASLLEITIDDHGNTWNMPCTRQSWANLLAAAAMRGVSEGAAIDCAFTAFAAANLTGVPVPVAAKVRSSLTWWQFALVGVVLLGAFAFNSLVIGHR